MSPPFPPTGLVTLVLGGARSGKSAHAERLALGAGGEPVYIATAEAHDEEMAERIARHRADRQGRGWTTVEEPLDLAGAIGREARPGRSLLVDCLTLWLSNVMLAGRDPADAQAALVMALGGAVAPVVLVSNEVGLGLVPETPLGRAFRDAQGRLNQAIAARADRVVFVAAGLPLTLKSA
ncbi:bifunctional adenosylcobinamide kinase/adenosylcobinamide-phosphate guanylyltransferase [Phreatobacter oligotrophus]|uniref:bifunctional adenosylcobinamide kinase/adenosylcobinamide-phosphate guanylyltransferase n=1 Tax=Phreatobacter oligotrophus TaxID=1122261 RepID=UPI0023553D5E|nr:bifunctional adenosylcobinamide kinase/adenosylcobinamide-phosphate guanylyltransferase [Phreatobacter oligotrophus]MBX9991008.1 bifunctional adenosylcobinamide kinase/adenosylcobinamide-phosphate guanylyltransferase [Phreatobacter oligotrophus]